MSMALLAAGWVLVPVIVSREAEIPGFMVGSLPPENWRMDPHLDYRTSTRGMASQAPRPRPARRRTR
jgi:hypothetical protein